MKRRIADLIIIFVCSILIYNLEQGDNTFFLIFGAGLLAAFSLGSLLNEIGLPKITSYLLLGIIYGPYVLNYFTFETIEKLQFIDGIALSIIAFVAGGEINFRQKDVPLGKVTIFVLLQIIILYPISMLILYFFGKLTSFSLLTMFIPILFLSLINNATSPSTTVAVIQETGSKGRLTDYVLISAVLKDILIIVLFAFFAALLAPASGTSLSKVIMEEVVSAIVGVGLGFFVIFYIRNIKLHQGVFLFLLTIIVTWIASHIHLNNLMIFLFTGIIVNNMSKLGHSVVEIIENNSQIIYVIFFFVAGNSINLNALSSMWMIAIFLFIARLMMLITTCYISASIIKENNVIKKMSGFGFIGQAGVSIGFAKIIATTFPEWGVSFQTLVLSVVGINQIFGPILFKLALKKAGETK
jgi:Kef-type K+ transport system membrane component KefB